MNNINLIGRITKETALKQTAGGTEFLPFTLAVKRRKEGTDFINCVAFGKTAELIHTYCGKGVQIGVTGRLEVNNKQENGEWKNYTNVVVEQLTFTEKKDQAQGYLPEYTKEQLQEVDAMGDDFATEAEKARRKLLGEEEKKDNVNDMFEQFNKEIFGGF